MVRPVMNGEYHCVSLFVNMIGTGMPRYVQKARGQNGHSAIHWAKRGQRGSSADNVFEHSVTYDQGDDVMMTQRAEECP